MGTEIAPMQDFIERLKTSLRDDVARMIPEAVLKQMIETVVREEFFVGKTTRVNGYDQTTTPKFHGLILDAVRPMLQAKAAEIALKMVPQIEAGVDELIRKSASEILLTTIDEVFTRAAQSIGNNWGFQNAVEQALKNKGIIRS